MPPTAIGRTMNRQMLGGERDPRLRGPGSLVRRGEIGDDLGPEEEDQERHEEPPRQQAAREVEGAELGPMM